MVASGGSSPDKGSHNNAALLPLALPRCSIFFSSDGYFVYSLSLHQNDAGSFVLCRLAIRAGGGKNFGHDLVKRPVQRQRQDEVPAAVGQIKGDTADPIG